MKWSEIISLIACIATIVGLYPSYRNIMNSKKVKKNSKKYLKPQDKIEKPNSDEPKLKSLEQTEKINSEESQQKPMSHFVKALVLTTEAVVVLIIEIIIFNWTANIFGIEPEINKMPLLWSIVFYSLFAVPGLFLFLAFINIASTFED